MQIRKSIVVMCVAGALGAFGCGGDEPSKSNNGGSNNGGSNNGTANNGVTDNNGTTNNGSTNNGVTNNGTANTNNGTANNTNNGTTNNGTTNTNNGTTNNVLPQTCNGSFGLADACGGDPTGTWTLDEVCSDFDFEGAAQAQCPQATVSNVVLDGTGTLVVAAGNWGYTVDASASADVVLPSDCKLVTCAQTATLIEAGGAESATCTDNAASGCDCAVTYDVSATSTGTYQTDGAGTATVSSGETYYYCVVGDSLQLREYGTPDDDAEPSFLLSK